MKNKTRFNLWLALGLTLALGLGIVWLSGGVQAQEASPQASLGTAFTYQGRLEDGSGPVDGSCDFKFSLWDTNSGGAQQGSEQTVTGVNVSNGYFSASLNDSAEFGSDAFQGEARYLQIKVKCSGDGSYVSLDGRVALNAAPYALSLRPGAAVRGSTSSHMFSVENEGTGDGIVAYNSSSLYNYAALFGLNDSTGSGVYGGNSGSGYGVYGYATASSGTNYGVYGKTSSASGHGVYGTSPSTNVLYAGVTGINTGGTGSGVYGSSNNGYGVYGKSGTAHGVGGISTSGYGVYGYSASGHAIYSDGDAHVEGDLTWKAKTSYVSVSAAAFRPAAGGYVFTNDGKVLWNADSASDYYAAPVQLPHGATVTKLTFYWWDGSADNGYSYLYRIDLAGSEATMATAFTSGSAATSDSSVDVTINYAAVDNSQYAYYLWLYLPDNLVAAYGVVIEYTFTEPY